MGITYEALESVIREGNQIIAVFDGYTFEPELKIAGMKGAYSKPGRNPMHPNWFDYNKSWSSIMPVCKKWHDLAMSWPSDDQCVYVEKAVELGRAILTFDINKVYPVLRDNIIWYNKIKDDGKSS